MHVAHCKLRLNSVCDHVLTRDMKLKVQASNWIWQFPNSCFEMGGTLETQVAMSWQHVNGMKKLGERLQFDKKSSYLETFPWKSSSNIRIAHYAHSFANILRLRLKVSNLSSCHISFDRWNVVMCDLQHLNHTSLHTIGQEICG